MYGISVNQCIWESLVLASPVFPRAAVLPSAALY